MDLSIELPRQQPSEPLHPAVEFGPKLIRAIVSRVYTVLVLVISLIILLTVKRNELIEANKKKISSLDLASEKYVFIVIILGTACNLLQLGMIIYGKITGKDMANNKYKIFFDYYVDKVVTLLIAGSVGAQLGSMLDIEQLQALTNVKMFFSVDKISSALLATVLVSSSISSSCSEKSMQNYRKSLEKGEEAVGFFRSWIARVYNYFQTRFSSS